MYATTPKKFVTVGGLYGAQPILAEVGMNFYVEKVADETNGRYYIHSWVNNPTTSQGTGNADYLGVKPAMVDDERIFSTTGDQTKKSIYLFVDRGKENTEDNGDKPSPDRVNGILSMLKVPLMVIKSILSGRTIRDITMM